VARPELGGARFGTVEPTAETLWCMASAWLDDIVTRAELEHRLASLGATRCDGYLVTESVPRWQPGAAEGIVTAGFQLLSILHRPDSMTHQQFVDHWVNSHLALSLDTHPQWTYVRNIITQPLNDGALPFDAVCEHGFAHPEHLTDPRYFYGAGDDPELLAKNREMIGADAVRFVDTQRTRSQTTVEHVFRFAFEPRARPGRPYTPLADL
jgi:hypothetical protein